MENSEVAVATITWARSPGEERRLGRSLGLLADSGLPVAVADRGTSAVFAERLRRLPGFSVTVPPAQGLVAQVQASFGLAATFGTPFILYVEPDKGLFFERRMSEFLRLAAGQSDVGIVLASRSAESFQTYPPMQRYTEGVINNLCAQRIGLAGDYSYGPFLMNRALLPHVAGQEHHLGWGWRHFVFLTARREGFRVVQVTDDYPCPPDQRCEDDAERTHRMRQLSQNILGLIE
jgi:hypothetical protein